MLRDTVKRVRSEGRCFLYRASAKRMRTFVAFVRLSRLTFLAGGVLGFAFGAAIAAFEGFDLSFQTYLAAQCLVTSFHLMVHYANDYFDRASDARTIRTEFSGGSGALVDGSLAPRVAIVAAAVCAALGTLATLGFALAGNLTLAGLGVAIGVLAWVYSAPPFRLLARGLGELDTALVVGVLVPLAGYAAFAHRLDVRAIAAAAASGGAMFAMMLAVEWPDRAADAATGKRNLVVRLGAHGTQRALRVAVGFAVCAGAGWGLLGALPSALLGVGLALPGIGLIRAFERAQSPAGEIAARGVVFFVVTLLFGLFAFVASRL